MNKKPENSGRKQAAADSRGQVRTASGRYRKGVSGNPRGKPKGARNKVTRAALELLEGECEALTRKAIDLALAGDTVALRLCLERIAPPRKEVPLEGLSLPPIQSPADLPRVMAGVLEAVSRGDITPGEAEKLARLVGEYGKATELADIEERLRALEEASTQSGGDLKK